jgi:signal transduction histidine kinase
MIKQLLRALIDNSVKYTQNGGIIHLSFGSEGENAVLSVSDDGIGMDAEHCEHIFERFYRVDPARTRATGGMGLGLSIVSVIAQAHSGYVSARSNPDAGTTVSVYLPR